MKSNVKKSVILFLLSYIIVTILAYGSSFAAAMLFKLPSHIDPGVSIFEDPAFVMTVPYHLLINLLIWVLFSYLYLRKVDKQYFWKEMYILSVTWLIAAMFVDLVFFVLIKTPYSLTAHQFYIEYQPWISITYFIVLLSPFIAAALAGPKVFR
jgi:hypothetical protein